MSADTKNTGQITLAIESAIRGGSVSLIADGREIANWIGSTDVSKAEDLLADIDAMLTQNGFTIRDITHAAVSAGPGSFTGIRIGIATALGLKTGLGIPMSSASALEAMARTSNFHNEAVIAVPVGRNAICVQRYSSQGPLDDPRSVSFEDFEKELEEKKQFVLHGSLFEHFETPESASDFGENIALAIGKTCIENPGVVDPLFISKSF